jgi:hemolysin activation/secretion protein
VKRWAFALLLAFSATGALAQSDSPPLSANDPTTALARPQGQSKPISPPPAPGAASALDTTPRFVLTSVTFEGARTVSAQQLQPAWAPYGGKSVSLADLREIARRAEHVYAQRGYPFVAVVVNPQNVIGGAVRFNVVEGRISDLTILGADPVARRQAAAAFEPLVNRQPLTDSDVESAYERATAIPGLAIAGALNRGSVAGGMDLLVQTKRQEWLFYANVNDLYPDPLGPWGALLGFSHYGGSPYGDEISGQVYESLDGGRQTVVRGNYERGLDDVGTTVNLTVLGAWANPGREVAPLSLATNVADGRIAFSQPIISRLSHSLTATVAFEVDDQKTDVFSRVGLTDDKLRIASIGLDGDWRYQDGARITMSTEVRQGLSVMGASLPGDPLLSRQGADPQATVGKISLEGVTPTANYVRFVVRIDGQLASAPLTAPDQYEVGNLTIGRGYQPGSIFGDDALAASGEMRFGPFPIRRVLQFEPFVFFDSTHIWTRTPGAPINRTLSSLGGGVRMETTRHLHIDLTYAKALDSPLGFGQPVPHGMLLVNATIGLNDVYQDVRRRLAPESAK